MESKSNKKAIITGITGQDGSYLTRFLLNKNYKIYGVITGLPGRDNFGNFKKLGISENAIQKVTIEDLDKVIADGDEIYNLAGQSSVGMSWSQPGETFEVNVNRYIRLLEICKNFKVKILQASSGEMYGDLSIPAREDMEMHPNNPYSLSKYTSYKYGQMMRETYNIWISNAILFNHESPLRDSKFVTRKIIDAASKIKKGELDSLELGNIEVERDWGFAEEYVGAMWRILQHDKPIDVNVATGVTITLKTFIKYVFEYYDIKNYAKYIKINQEFIRANDTKSMKADITILKNIGICTSPISPKNINKLI